MTTYTKNSTRINELTSPGALRDWLQNLADVHNGKDFDEIWEEIGLELRNLLETCG